MSRISFERTPTGRSNRGTWSRKEEEYIADFELVSRRHLDDWHYRIFRYHFLLGADWKLCRKRLPISRGNFYHTIYRIEERLGKVFYELEPYPLYPPREYFALSRKEPVKPFDPPLLRRPVRFRYRQGTPPSAGRAAEKLSA